MPVILSPQAARDIEDIGDYIYTQNAHAALRFVSALRSRLDKIADAPRGGVRRTDIGDGIRSVPFRRYVIFYTVPSDDEVRIERVLHGARDIDAVFIEDAEDTD
ncbi:type II toxin-antitoxin system RelE/ParE family toxin [Mycoplana rhizolycopersici]|uniref:Type II toxin-antitoxin system RelE/ParE family toxin n=1 Tax=Mycoplana rhizolycopersici TaxID=2746702 RepID=A0ABX2QIF5_9HYPH|nr:type II toxin-antitoxin system RelE/ParE family toxin [Rhizobium rhizolycopersici]NVP56373.1 type II toxin-antitoxin system RelE/ParE family toxin [Rhizobium rhizolycopersici]